MTPTLTKTFVKDVLGACPDGQRRAEFCRDVATGYRVLAKQNGDMAAEQTAKANQYMELARRLDARATRQNNKPYLIWDSEDE